MGSLNANNNKNPISTSTLVVYFDGGIFLPAKEKNVVRNQIERLKKDLRSLEDYEIRMKSEERYDCIRGILIKKQYVMDHIEQLLNNT